MNSQDNSRNTIDVKGMASKGEFNNERKESEKYNLSVVKAVPLECHPCSFCNSKENMYMEMPEYGNWTDNSFVGRVGCVCKKSLQGYRDFNRTDFLDLFEVSNQWNNIQELEIDDDSEVSF